jgi:hypothetical protein
LTDDNEIQINTKMKKFLMALLFGMLILNSCYKDDSRPWDEKQSTSVKMENIITQPNFDWKTTKVYPITLYGNNLTNNAVVKITSKNNVVYQKVFILAGTPSFTTIVTLPAYETVIHLVYNNQDIELSLSNPLTYSL